jgi:hypothetical protein
LRAADSIFITFDNGEFYWNSSIYSNLGSDKTKITGTLYEDLHVFQHMEMTWWRVCVWNPQATLVTLVIW